MCSLVISFAALLGFAAASPLKAPNGGRIITAVEPHAEFLVTPEKRVELRFLADDGTVVSPAGQVVTIIMGDRLAPTRLSFTREGDKLISDRTVAEGNNLPLVLQIRSAPDAKPVNAKFHLNFSRCPECQLAEYACSCHGSSEEEPHSDHAH